MAKSSRADRPATLDSVCDRLDVLIALLIPPTVKNAQRPKGLQLNIVELCDYEHTTDDIRKRVKKTLNHVNKELSALRSKGMIRTVSRDGQQVHVRLQ